MPWSIEYILHDNAFDDDPFRLADLPFDGYYPWETITTFGPSGGVVVGGHAAAVSIPAVVPVPLPAAGGGGAYYPYPSWPFPLPKARPIITTFGPYPVRLEVGGHAGALTIHAVSPEAVALEISGTFPASIRRLYKLVNGGPALEVGGSGNPHARAVKGISGGLIVGGHAEAHEAQDWIGAAIAREDEELLLELIGVL